MNMTALDLNADLVSITRAIVDIESVSGNEKSLADLVEAALKQYPHLEVIRDGDTVVARTHLGRKQRAVIAGHLDTVPLANNLPSKLINADGAEVAEVEQATDIWGRGTCDMKGGDAVFLKLAAELTQPKWDVTWIFYDHEEVASELNSLTRIAKEHPEYLQGDFAILGEPSNAQIEAGCKGTMRARIYAQGKAAHSARDWIGHNAIHDLAGVLAVLDKHESRIAVLDGLEYRECLNAVKIEGGIAGNVIPDRAFVEVNYRFAPDKSGAEATAYLKGLFADLPVQVEVTDLAEGAMPGLSAEAAQEFLTAVGDVEVSAKQGWTDVARFTAMGTPAVNFGPANPLDAHTDEEHVRIADLDACYQALKRWLG